ncbi:MAG: hypothetical protein HY731_04635 [Candidatus Tectomicrobia bacterium]|nr:hypothetical protein [Candidatus Tectomicrobia bacterium]
MILPLDDPDLFKENLGLFLRLKQKGEAKVLVVVIDTVESRNLRLAVGV